MSLEVEVVKTELKPWQLEPELVDRFERTGFILIAGGQIAIAQAEVAHAEPAAQLMCNYGDGALVNADAVEEARTKVLSHVENGLGFVGILTDTGEVVSYQGVTLWPTIPVAEPGSAVTRPDMRGKGINTIAKKLALTLTAKRYPQRSIVFFTEAASKSRGIIQKLGVTPVSLTQVQQEWMDLASVCPDKCYLKCGHPCGCQVFVLK